MYAKPNRPHRTAKRLALEAARKEGCCCDAEVHVLGASGDAAMMVLAHDDWCPFLRARREGAGAPGWDLTLFPKGSVSGDEAA